MHLIALICKHYKTTLKIAHIGAEEVCITLGMLPALLVVAESVEGTELSAFWVVDMITPSSSDVVDVGWGMECVAETVPEAEAGGGGVAIEDPWLDRFSSSCCWITQLLDVASLDDSSTTWISISSFSNLRVSTVLCGRETTGVCRTSLEWGPGRGTAWKKGFTLQLFYRKSYFITDLQKVVYKNI